MLSAFVSLVSRGLLAVLARLDPWVSVDVVAVVGWIDLAAGLQLVGISLVHLLGL